MDDIFHEKQEGFLCAQHCLNALLQGNYFTAVDLSAIANDLDTVERIHLSEAGYGSRDYLRHVASGSENMDDTGFFSIQVISEALKVWDLDLIVLPQNSTLNADMLDDKQAFICHFKQHWYTIRKLGFQWFNLNSLFHKPQLISVTYLCLYITQLQQEGYTIFQVNGILPECKADELLKICPVNESQSSSYHSINNATEDNMEDDDDDALKKALAESLKQDLNEDPSFQTAIYQTLNADYERDLASAIEMSLENNTASPQAITAPATSTEEADSNIREDVIRRRENFLKKLEQSITDKKT